MPRMQSKATTVDAYLKSLPEDRRAAIQAIRKAINANLGKGFQETMQYNVRTVARGLMQSWKSGEGFVAEFVGPGVVYIQTRAPQSFGPWLSQYIPRGS